uniref:Metallo-beta-lactamase domain-containing protein n=1 Tax=Amphimedon queenslandica TaxID=400682 RepID=A0A1X7TTZ1_AMPQE
MSSNLLSVYLFIAGLVIHMSLCYSELPPADDNLNIYALPVGQGDCTVIQCPKTSTDNGKGDVTIIDAGSNKKRFKDEAFHNYLREANIKYVILTHPHNDHFNLIDPILEGHGESLHIYHSCDRQRYVQRYKHRNKFVEALNSYQSSKIEYCLGATSCNTKITLCDSVSLTVIASELGGCGKHPNEDSIVSKITYNGVSALFPGDLEGSNKKINAFLQGAGAEIKADIYRLAHHGAYAETGSKQCNRRDLLRAVGASYYFSSSGLHEGYRHPRCKLYREIRDNDYTDLQVDYHPYTCYEDDGTKEPHTTTTNKPIYVTTLEENETRKDYVIRFAIKKDGTIVPSITPFNGASKRRQEF